ncbi:MAG: hypothetical protein ACXWE6_12640 [Nitrososphaeraceae archaeon]
MIQIANFGQPIDLHGKSGERYSGRIYDKECLTSSSGRAIICLTNSTFSEHSWIHSMNSIFKTDDAEQSFQEFQKRNDISHVIIIPLPIMEFGKSIKVEDLIHQYLHG